MLILSKPCSFNFSTASSSVIFKTSGIIDSGFSPLLIYRVTISDLETFETGTGLWSNILPAGCSSLKS